MDNHKCAINNGVWMRVKSSVYLVDTKMNPDFGRSVLVMDSCNQPAHVTVFTSDIPPHLILGVVTYQGDYLLDNHA